MKTLFTSFIFICSVNLLLAQTGLELNQSDANGTFLKIKNASGFNSTLQLGLNFINTTTAVFGEKSVLRMQTSSGNVTIGNTETLGNSTADARLTIRSFDDALSDLKLEGHGRISSPNSIFIKLDDDNDSNHSFIIVNSNDGHIFQINENLIHTMTGDLTLSGNLSSNNYPDYVFEPDYKLISLSALNKKIQELGHLPEIPSAEEVNENGMTLGDMTKRLLKKIEELTLYVIDLQDQIDSLKN